MNDDLRRNRAQPFGEISRGEIELQVGPGPAARDAHFDGWIARKRTANARAEISAAADDDDARCAHAGRPMFARMKGSYAVLDFHLRKEKNARPLAIDRTKRMRPLNDASEETNPA